MRDVVIVLGMHRSGTSAVAGVLTKLGGAAPKTLMLPTADNPGGYFESAVVAHFHDELLKSAGSSWDDWRKFDDAWYRSPDAEAFTRRARTMFEAEFANADLAILKDPRICRFFPFWADALAGLDIAPRVVMPIRSPLEVAQSLKTRDGIPIAQGALLWLRHVLDGEVQTRNIPRSIFAWNQFHSDWRQAAEKISGEIGVSWPHQSNGGGPQIDAFVDGNLVHARFDDAALSAHAEINRWTVAAYEAMLELARNPLSNSAVETLNDVRQSFDQACLAFGPVLASYEAGMEYLRAHFRSAHGGAIFVDFSKERALVEARARYEHNAAMLREKEGLIDILNTRARDLESSVQAAREEADRLAAVLDDTVTRHRQLERSAAEQKRAAAAALAEGEAKAATEREAIEDKLSIAEATLAKTKRPRSLPARLRSVGASRRAERLLLKSGLFDPDWYASEYPDVAKRSLSPVRHYLEEGYLRGYRPNPLFDSLWYLRRYEDVRRSGTNPLLHYVLYGAREGRDPGPDFQTDFYFAAYPDVRAAKANPLAHYLRHGKAEGRLAKRPQRRR